MPKQGEPGTVVYLPFQAPVEPQDLSPKRSKVAARGSKDQNQAISLQSSVSSSQSSASLQRAEAPDPGALPKSQTDAQKQTQFPLDLTVPKSVIRDANRSEASVAAQDPRSNSPRLSLSERFTVNLGAVDCYIDERLPDGTKLRRPGRRIPVERLHSQATGDERPVYICV